MVQLIIRPFVDFYFNYGLTRASVLAYVLCANLIIFVYLFMTIGVTITLDPLVSPSETRRFLEIHFLWPSPEKILLDTIPDKFGLLEGSLVSDTRYQRYLSEYCTKYNTTEEKLKAENKLKVTEFSITDALGTTIYKSTRTFYEEKNKIKINPLGAGFFFILAIAYYILLLSIKTNLSESVTPLVWGNLPISHRGSRIQKLLWRVPPIHILMPFIFMFLMLPILATITITLMSSTHKIIDVFLERYSFSNVFLSTCFSLLFTTLMFMFFYKLFVSLVSYKSAAWGAFIAAVFWLGGRWYFTTFSAVSLYRNLRNFALVPIFLTWFYYFCAVFLVGIVIAHTMDTPKLTYTSRCWLMRDLSCMNRYGVLSQWIRLDFLYRLAVSHYEEVRPPFIGIKLEDDTALEIATASNLHSHFVRECILIMLLHHANDFIVEEQGNKQYCRLKNPPEEVNVLSLIVDPQDIQELLDEMKSYTFYQYIQEKHKLWNAPRLLLSDVYKQYKDFKNISNNVSPMLEYSI